MEVLHARLKKGDWLYDVFENAYVKESAHGIMKVFSIAGSDDPAGLNFTNMLNVRLFIEGGKETIGGQKYIAGLRFYSFGDMATLDIISLDKPYHRKIAMAHAQKMCWTQQDDQEDLFRRSYMIPLMVVGGYLSVYDQDVELADHSQDYGGDLLGCDVNALVWYITSLCGLSDVADPAGKQFVVNLLAFMKEHCGKHDFYERLAQIHSKNTGQHCGGMLMMKIMDRMIAEKKEDLSQMIMDEITDGFAQKYVVNGALNVLRQ
jgi:hypothetical protein